MKYTAKVTSRSPRPRSKRLREQGIGGAVINGGTVVTTGGGVGAGSSVGGHTHANKPSLDQITTNNEGYLLLTQLVEKLDPVTGAAVLEEVTRKVKAGYADEAGSLTGVKVYQDKDGNWHLETDYVDVRMKLTAKEVEIQTVYHIAGAQIKSSANMKCVKVEELPDAYRCYMNVKDDDGNEIRNMWRPNDQAYVQTFNLVKQSDGTVGNHFVWALVTAVGLDYIDVSKSVKAIGSNAPKAGDDIVQLGYRGTDDASRQVAVIDAGAGSDAPYYRQFVGIKSFDLPEPETQLKPGDNKLSGVLHIEKGSTGAANLKDLPDFISELNQFGTVNLLRNSGFAGDYDSEALSADTPMNPDLEMYSKHLKHWSGMATVLADPSVPSGYVAEVGSLSQPVNLIAGEKYVISYLAKGTQLVVSCGNFSVSQPLSGEYTRYVHKFTYNGTGVFSAGGTASVYSIQLERGTVATDWSPSPFDTDKAAAKYLAVDYISSAIKDGSVDILGGLILASMLQLGNYKDGKMQEVTAGVSGIFNDGDDVAFWAGGTYEKAIRTVMKFKNNPGYRPTDEDWAELANFVATHGGDLFMRGYIYALGGMFRGTVFAEDGEFNGAVNLQAKGGKIVLTPEDQYGFPCIDIYDREGAHLAFITVGLGVTGDYEPRVALFSKDEKRELNLRPDLFTIEEKRPNNKRYRTEIAGGRIRMSESDVTKWEQSILPK